MPTLADGLQKAAQRSQDGDPKRAFTVVAPDGQLFEVFADGRIYGFPEGSAVINRIPPYADRRAVEHHAMMAG